MDFVTGHIDVSVEKLAQQLQRHGIKPGASNPKAKLLADISAQGTQRINKYLEVLRGAEGTAGGRELQTKLLSIKQALEHVDQHKPAKLAVMKLLPSHYRRSRHFLALT